MPNSTVRRRRPTWNTSGTHAPRDLRKNPPAYAFQTFAGAGHAAIRSERTADPLVPHVIAARLRHAWGTLTARGSLPARTTSPAFRQYGQGWPGVRTTCGMNADGTAIPPRTRR
jgi:hypothetical protein